MEFKNTAVFFIAAIILQKLVADAGGIEAADTCSHYHFHYTSQYNQKIKYRNCRGYSQSPINIVSVSRDIYTSTRFIRIRGWCQSLTGEWTNNGHTPKFSPLNNQPQAYLDSYGHHGFVFKQFHLHWGSNRGQGSEYTINRYSYDGEMHFVFTGSINGVRRYTVLQHYSSSLIQICTIYTAQVGTVQSIHAL